MIGRQIKTIIERFIDVEYFDSEVNKALKNGWLLDRRYIVEPCPRGGGGYVEARLVAELYKHEEVK